MPKPYFIVLEGIDGSGTTTQCRALAAALTARGHEVFETREPSTGVIGRLIRTHLSVGSEPLDPAAFALLFAADRLDHLAREIEPALAAGQTVLCDRYVLSSWAYQSLDSPLTWVKAINSRARWPDLTLFVDVDADVALGRVQARVASGASTPEVFEVPDVQRRLVQTYRELATDAESPGIRRVDGHEPLSEVTAALLRACESHGL